MAGRGRKQNKGENTKRVRRVTGEERNKTNKEVRRTEKKYNSDSFWGKLKKEEREGEGERENGKNGWVFRRIAAFLLRGRIAR